jgi:hypothetical protein
MLLHSAKATVKVISMVLDHMMIMGMEPAKASQSNRQSARSTLVTDGAYSDVDRTDNIFQFATNDYRDSSDNVDE